jgi:hypothetical protein
MNTLLETLPSKEKEHFKQVIAFYDDKKFKKAQKVLKKLVEMNPGFVGWLTRVLFDESVAELLRRQPGSLRGEPQTGQNSRLKRT